MTTTTDRVLGVLALFSGDRWKWTVEEAADELRLPTSTVYRYFKSLTQAELITSQLTGSYVLGPAICALDRSMRLHDPFISAAKGEMAQLAAAYPNSIILLTRLYKNTVMCVHREGEGLAAHGYERGRPMPLDRGAASKAILAHLPPRQFKSLSASDDKGQAPNLHALGEELRAIKAQGFSITRGEIDPGKVGISVPVFRDKHVLEGSLSFVLDGARTFDEGSKIEALIRARKAVEANLLVAEFQSSHEEG